MLAKTILWRPALCVGIAFFALFMFEPHGMQSEVHTAALNQAQAPGAYSNPQASNAAETTQLLQALHQENRALRSKLASLPAGITPALTAAAANGTNAGQAVARRNASVALPTNQVNDS